MSKLLLYVVKGISLRSTLNKHNDGFTVPKNIKGVKAVDGTNLLITSSNVF